MLIKNINDLRKNQTKKIGIFCPVGDRQQFIDFLKFTREKGLIDGLDYMFICRDGLELPENELSAIYAYEAAPLGTSGSFVVGQNYLYKEGYKFIVVADLDAFLDSRKTFDEMVDIAKDKKKVVVTRSLSKEDMHKDKIFGYNVNQWGIYPREIFEKYGFIVPYMMKGGDDYEMICRLKHYDALYVYEKGYVDHPKNGYTMYEKFQNKKKFFPYMAGHLKVFLLMKFYDRKAYLKYLLWHLYYCYYADVFFDKDFIRVINSVWNFSVDYEFDNYKYEDVFEIKAVRDSGIYPVNPMERFFTSFYSLFSLLFFKTYDVYIHRVFYKKSRIRLLFGMAVASILIPYRFLQGLFNIVKWRKERDKLIYPIKPEKADEALNLFVKMLENKRLV